MIKFCKFHGYGNDYLIFANNDLSSVTSFADFARKVCDRHRGVGADGIAIFEETANEEADFTVRIFNPDGSEAGFSGNGTRCAAAHLLYNKLWKDKTIRLKLSSGIKKYSLSEKGVGGNYIFAAEIGRPQFDSESIPMQLAVSRKRITEFPIELKGFEVLVSAVNVGNPVACIFVKDFDEFDWRTIGAGIETHAMFYERTNVVFVKVVDEQNLEIRIWERGASETSSSGTCSAAAAVTSVLTKKTKRQVSVHAPGGTSQVEWREIDDEIVLTGRADLVFCGDWIEK